MLRAVDTISIPNLDVSLFGWTIDGNVLIPNHGNASVAPDAVPQLVACRCKSDNPCARNSCSCRSARIHCTSYCKCYSGELCSNDILKSTSNTHDTPQDNETDTVVFDEL